MQAQSSISFRHEINLDRMRAYLIIVTPQITTSIMLAVMRHYKGTIMLKVPAIIREKYLQVSADLDIFAHNITLGAECSVYLCVPMIRIAIAAQTLSISNGDISSSLISLVGASLSELATVFRAHAQFRREYTHAPIPPALTNAAPQAITRFQIQRVGQRNPRIAYETIEQRAVRAAPGQTPQRSREDVELRDEDGSLNDAGSESDRANSSPRR